MKRVPTLFFGMILVCSLAAQTSPLSPHGDLLHRELNLSHCGLFNSAEQQSDCNPITIELSPRQGDVLVPKGTIAVYDAANGKLAVHGTLVIHGTLHVVSSNASVQDLTIEAAEIKYDGAIVSDLSGGVTLQGDVRGDLHIIANGGVLDSKAPIALKSAANILVQGGRFAAPALRFESPSELVVNAERIDAKVDLDAPNVAV